MNHRLLLDAEELEALREVSARAQRKPVVLLADDDRATLVRVRGLIEGANLRCLTARSAQEALRRIRRDEAGIDLLVSGLRVERDGTGLDLLRELGNVGTFLPIIVLSGQGDRRDIYATTALNVLDFLAKPVESVDFLNLLKRYL
ncbi:DNA-binding NtrC family response regulator [Pseudomonas nitritireducens]|uniref:DNA-binding NtrC family response regulator n=1 Tax=Pseudomonas nitroreducens TaxID=46680 RepID=A0A7W7KMW0_PSENT|nr:response regulator [Pseudomonas nitritireducens]MBB4865213.1 DNA-binding NtrC family response regulator [Pseudomonas nitritireducens]